MDRYAPAALTLVDGDVRIPIRPVPATAGDPIYCTSWDLGAPDVRVTTIPRPGADGVDETAGYTGSRTVTLELRIKGDGAGQAGGHDAYWYANQLTGMCHPARRPTLVIQRGDESSAGKAWFLALRGEPWNLPYDKSSAALLTMTLSFVANSGFESELHTVHSPDANNVASTDWHFPAAFPKGFGPTSGKPQVVCNVAGTSPINPTVFIYGPIKNPDLVDDLGNEFKFTGLTLVAGQVLRVDMGSGSVLVATDETGFTNTSADVFHTVDFEVSTFWQWPPGSRKVNLLTDSGSFAVQWRDRQSSI